MTWNWRQRRMKLLFGVACVACGLALAHPAAAHAGWPLAESSSVLVGFGASYTSADSTATQVHHGVDIAAEPGAQVLAPLGGHVTFAGAVPASGGGTMKAVTISTSEGSLTLMPLATLSVAKGDDVAERSAIGLLAQAGDGSSASTHVHVGLKRGDVYVDPLSVMSAPAAAASAGGQTAGAGAAAPHAASASAVLMPHAASAAGAHAGTSPAAAAPRTAGAHATSAGTAGALAPLRAAVPGAQLAAGVTVAGSGAHVAVGAAAAPSQASAALPLAAGTSIPALASHAHVTAQPHALTVRELAGRIAGAARASARATAYGLLGIFAALGALWPLWRRERGQGLGEAGVRPISDDVAAVVGR